MAFKFKIGAAVRQVMPKPMEGMVTKVEISGDDVIFKVESTDANGDHRARFFKEDEIEVVPTE
jgi:hypothetical protein